MPSTTLESTSTEPESSASATSEGPSDEIVDKYTAVPITTIIRPSITDKARTITHVCTSGTLCTSSMMEGVEGFPFGSYVDYILDEKGWPVLLLSEQSLHTTNIKQNKQVSLFCQLPRSQSAQTLAALSRVSTIGVIEPITDKEELNALKLAFTLVHPYSEQIVDSPKFTFFKLKPLKIYFSGGFGVMATWVDVSEYELARPDVLAQEVPLMLSRVNVEKTGELSLLVKHFLNISDADSVRIQAIDRLGVDLRVQVGEYTDEYRIGFRHQVSSAEDAKSEVMKLFQESWERENGFFFTDTAPPVTKYAEDILRR
eukprot:CAMPEP_0182419636 /NCGR_PEP_ID=MMETSP1167-20130531/4034_1 /TAXON_ID=2988 /ORGANISM="Mallomonas Sp, Strain CCMP3275" /LENGTH=313 /DNA_ID=CAMNT_0024594659 /DNA_START=118 /DNA_END=1059 /DNA_ORIENTATION=+